jgi:hypothetical protein
VTATIVGMWNAAARKPYGGVYPCKLITVTGVRAYYRTFWHVGAVKAITPCNECAGGHIEVGDYTERCPNNFGGGTVGDTHEGTRLLEDVHDLEVWGRWDDVQPTGPDDPRWPSVCDHCGALAPAGTAGPYKVGDRHADVTRVVNVTRLYSNPSGAYEVGDLVYLPCNRAKGDGCPYWDNCTGRHLHAVLPNGHLWDIDSRANNCTLRNDRTHRCWTQEGDPAVHLTVGKRGPTCAAGAGSIQHGDYHGFVDGHVISPNRGQGRRP